MTQAMTWRGAAVIGTLLLGLSLALPVARPARAADPCRAPDDAVGAITALPHVASVVHEGGTLRVLAVGSATMFGPNTTLQNGTVTSQALNRASGSPTVPSSQLLGPSTTDAAFPMQMAQQLQKAVPGLKVEVVLRGGRGLSAAEMLALIRTEVAGPAKFQLVLWQTGTVEAVRNTPPGEFGQVLSSGAEAVDEAGANLVLIDPQYSRFLQTNSNLDPYAQALQQTASMPGVLLFHRFELMRGWANAGQIDLERTPKGDRLKAVETLHACLGASLARMVLAGARS